MASDRSSDYIAGYLTGEDWQARKVKLGEAENETVWAETFEAFLMGRLSPRYLEPIKILQDNGGYQGEGFTIVSVQCALIEFLAALKEGKSYKFKEKGEKPGEFEYTNSSDLFCEFLVREVPFKEYFPDLSAAKDFYKNVRCALLHEACTKNGWRIWASGSTAVDVNSKVVRRDALQVAINAYLENYKKLLMKDKSVQEAFIRKFDHLADI